MSMQHLEVPANAHSASTGGSDQAQLAHSRSNSTTTRSTFSQSTADWSGSSFQTPRSASSGKQESQTGLGESLYRVVQMVVPVRIRAFLSRRKRSYKSGGLKPVAAISARDEMVKKKAKESSSSSNTRMVFEPASTSTQSTSTKTSTKPSKKRK